MRETPLLERSAELAAAAEAIGEVAGGRGRLVVFDGVAGIGKTRLLAQLRRLPGAGGFQVLSARGSDLERHFAFGIVRQLFEPVVMMSGDGERRRLLSGAARGAEPVFAAGDPAAVDADLAVLHGLYWLTVNVCERPTMLLVDDLHWSDVASLRYLAYLLPRLDGVGLLVAVVVRAGERATDEPLLRRVTSAPGATTLRPAPLTEGAAAKLLAEVLGEVVQPPFAASCFHATAGNPLLLAALAATLAGDGVAPTVANRHRVLEVGPRAVAHLVSVRLSGARRPLRDVAAAAAVLGQHASLPAVAELAGVDLVEAAEAADELARMGLLEAGSAAAPRRISVSYAHPLMEAAVYGALSARERAEAHGRAAAVLSRLGADPERVGVHLLKTPAGGGDRTIAALRHAAELAERRGSAEAALAFRLRCLDEDASGRLPLLLEAARVAVHVDLHAAVPLLEEAKGLASGTPAAAYIAMELGRAYGFLLEPAQAAGAFGEAAADLPTDDEDHRRRLEATLLVGAFIVAGRHDVVGRIPALKALPAHDSLGGRMLQAAIAEHETATCDPNGPARARAALVDGMLVREANGEGALVCGWLALLAADDPAGLASLDSSVEQAHLYGSVRALAAAYCFRSLGRLWRGQLAEAETDAREALRLTQTGRVDMDPVFAGAYLADALIEQDRLDEAEATLSSIGVPGGAPAKPRYWAVESYARLLRHQGRHDAALAAAMEAGQLWRAFGFRNPGLEGWRGEASLALFALGRTGEANALAREELDLASRWGAPRALGRALRVTGQVTAGADGLALLHRSATTLAGSVARLEYARSLLELGAALRRAGQRAAAREQLSLALDHAEICGAAPVAALAATELRTAGYRPRRHRLTGLAALTPSERRVAEAAAAGATNREIAQSLFVTTKTVEVHLSSVFRKLGVSRRTELAKHLDAAKS